jgi:ABC-type Fe3+ transport system permease subunit
VDHDAHGLLGLPDRHQPSAFRLGAGGRDQVRRTRRDALSRRHRHHAEGGLRAAVHRLAGFDIASKVALAAFIATFPIVVSTAAGLYAASENERMLFKSMGARRWQTLIRLKLPTGLPYIFTGLKIASVGVMAGAITGEFLGGGEGLAP